MTEPQRELVCLLHADENGTYLPGGLIDRLSQRLALLFMAALMAPHEAPPAWCLTTVFLHSTQGLLAGWNQCTARSILLLFVHLILLAACCCGTCAARNLLPGTASLLSLWRYSPRLCILIKATGAARGHGDMCNSTS
jgi:hypothetical protein